jgi:hypothetical protein
LRDLEELEDLLNLDDLVLLKAKVVHYATEGMAKALHSLEAKQAQDWVSAFMLTDDHRGGSC